MGAAGIRGTTFRIVFRPDANGRVTFTLSTSDGVVLFEAPASAGVSVETGKEVAVDVEVAVDAATGTVTVVAPPVITSTQDIPPATEPPFTPPANNAPIITTPPPDVTPGAGAN